MMEDSSLRKALERLVEEADSFVGIGYAFNDEDLNLREAIEAARKVLETQK